MKRIYVGEDQPDLAEMLERLLGSDPRFDVTTFPNGLDVYREAVKAPPDLLILDILLPFLTGLAVTRLLKFHRDFSHIPVLVMSSIIDPDIDERAQRAGADFFMPKPINAAVLLSTVERLLGLG